MAQLEKAKVFMSGRSQAVRLPVAYRFPVDEVYISRDPKNGNVILSQTPTSLDDIFAALDEAGIPEDFLSPADRRQPPLQKRDEV